jgi:hypothetical protein
VSSPASPSSAAAASATMAWGGAEAWRFRADGLASVVAPWSTSSCRTGASASDSVRSSPARSERRELARPGRGRCVSICLDKNRREVVKSQPIWTDSKTALNIS